MSNPQPIDLDSTDERIVELLREDGRMPYRALARELELTEATVRARVRRLEESNVMRVVAVTDFEAAGYEFMLAVGVQVENRTPEEVAQELALIPEVFSINVVIGTYDLELLVVAENQSSLTQLIYERLASLPGIRRVVPSIAVNVLKNQPDWVPFHTPAEGAM
jgi:DNA-binding Lrp family transcriptional regulator